MLLSITLTGEKCILKCIFDIRMFSNHFIVFGRWNTSFLTKLNEMHGILIIIIYTYILHPYA